MASKLKTVKSTKKVTTPIKLRSITVPEVGEYWPGQGGIFAGMMRGRDGTKSYALILGPMLPESNFDAATKKAAKAKVDGHKDFRPPYRNEQSLLFANLKDHFKSRWYWSCERRAVDEDYAWCQWFDDGFQDYGDVSGTGLGCAVRVVKI